MSYFLINNVKLVPHSGRHNFAFAASDRLQQACVMQ